MREIALHLLDIAENSAAAEAKNIEIFVWEDLYRDRLIAAVQDDGVGMDADMLAAVVDPFVTSRTTRKVGLGIPLLKAAAEACNGNLAMTSTPGIGTHLEVNFQHSHIDRMPLGDLASTLLTLVIGCPEIRWRFTYRLTRPAGPAETQEYLFDTQPIRDELGEIPLCEPAVLAFLRSLLEEGISEARANVPEPV